MKEAYLITFSGDTHTYINAETEGHARVCVNDFDPLPAGYGPDDYQEYSEAFDQVIALFNSAAKHGSIPTLQYLNDLGYDNPCNSETRQSAASYGHIHILQYCRSRKRTFGSIDMVPRKRLSMGSPHDNCR
jgi:hypothetical protein